MVKIISNIQSLSPIARIVLAYAMCWKRIPAQQCNWMYEQIPRNKEKLCRAYLDDTKEGSKM